MHSGKHEHHHADHALSLTFWLTLGFGFVELYSGWISNSLALFTDATHMFSDSAGILIAFVALHLARTRDNELLEIWGGLLGGLLVLVMSGTIFYKGIVRWNAPEIIQANTVIGIGLLGLGVNLFCIWKVWEHRSENLNLRAVFLHLMGDALGSLGAIASGILISQFNLVRADPGFSVIFSAFVFYGGLRVIRDAFLEIKQPS